MSLSLWSFLIMTTEVTELILSVLDVMINLCDRNAFLPITQHHTRTHTHTHAHTHHPHHTHTIHTHTHHTHTIHTTHTPHTHSIHTHTHTHKHTHHPHHTHTIHIHTHHTHTIHTHSIHTPYTHMQRQTDRHTDTHTHTCTHTHTHLQCWVCLVFLPCVRDSCDPRDLRDLKRISHPITVRLLVNKDLSSSQQGSTQYLAGSFQFSPH